MKKKEYWKDQKFKKFIDYWLHAYERVLQVRDYRGTISYSHENEKSKEGFETHATACVDDRYLTVDYTIFPIVYDQWKAKKYFKVKRTLAHEVAHIATHKLYRMATSIYKDEGETVDAWESLTQRVGRLMYDLFELENNKK